MFRKIEKRIQILFSVWKFQLPRLYYRETLSKCIQVIIVIICNYVLRNVKKLNLEYTISSNNMVPVVMGGHPNDYRAAAPENSFIHVEDFESPQVLAQYLQYLNENDNEYNKYFEWKGLGELIDTKFLCRICGMTHYANYVPPPNRSMEFKWEDINQHELCLPPNQMYWNSRT